MDNGNFLLVTADSTGHGVPGAIMSILNMSCLNEAVNGKKIVRPNEVLDYTRDRIIEHMSHDGSELGGKDGMDAIACVFDFSSNKLSFAAANNPLWIYRGNEIIEFKPDKMPVGAPMGEMKPFSIQNVDLKKGDLIVTITDGYADQFGGEKGKKFMYKPMKELIFSLKHNSLIDIREKMRETFFYWKNTNTQVDDVLVIGVRV